MSLDTRNTFLYSNIYFSKIVQQKNQNIIKILLKIKRTKASLDFQYQEWKCPLSHLLYWVVLDRAACRIDQFCSYISMRQVNPYLGDMTKSRINTSTQDEPDVLPSEYRDIRPELSKKSECRDSEMATQIHDSIIMTQNHVSVGKCYAARDWLMRPCFKNGTIKGGD